MSESTTTPELPKKHTDHSPWPAGTKVTGTFSVWNEAEHDYFFRKRTVTVVSYDKPSADNGHWGSYTVRFADGTEDSAHPKWLTLAGRGAPKAHRAKVDKPDPASLPRIMAMDTFTDSGEFGNATCPHCGALGRYFWTFHCSDGTKRGAMAGCIKLFPRSKVADEHAKLIERRDKKARDGGKLASWDLTKLAAVEALVAGEMTEGDCLRVMETENAKRAKWLEKRHGGRRW